MSQPYVGRPNDFGILTITQDKLNDLVAEIQASGFQVGVHANGDVAIDMVLKAYELVNRTHPRKDARPRIQHCTLINPDLLRRIAAIGAIPTPFYTYVYYHGDKWAQYGEDSHAACCGTDRFSIMAFVSPERRITCRGRTNRSWPSRA